MNRALILVTGLCLVAAMSLRGVCAEAAESAVDAGEGPFAKLAREDRAAHEKITGQYAKIEDIGDKLSFLLKHVDVEVGSKHNLVLYWLAKELGEFVQDPRAAEALKKLCGCRGYYHPDHAGGSAHIVIAQHSLQLAAASKDLERISAATTAKQLVGIIERHVHEGPTKPYAWESMRDAVYSKAKEDPKVFVPLLARYYPNSNKEIQALLIEHRELTEKSLPDAFRDFEPAILLGATQLARYFKTETCIPHIARLLYSDAREGDTLYKTEAVTALVAFGDAAVPDVERVLYSQNSLAQHKALVVLGNIETERSTNVLKRFCELYSRPRIGQDKDVLREAQAMLAGRKGALQGHP